MKTLLAILSISGLTACAQVPTIQHCSEVHYERKGIDITVTAKCQVPLGSPMPGL